MTLSSYNVSGDTINPMREFNSTIEREQNIDELDDYVLQGLCKVDDKYLLSAYDNNHSNSIIYVLDEDLEHYYTRKLDISSHVGGIAYDSKHNNIWVTDTDGSISAYDKDDVLDGSKALKRKYEEVDVSEGLENFFGVVSAAYITYYDDKIYVGNFSGGANSIIKEYDVLDDGMIDTGCYNKYNVSHFVQGVTFYEKDGVRYLITSSSFGQFLPSKLQIYDFDSLEKVKEFTTKRMMEEIIVDDDKLITLYESNAKIYKGIDSGKDIIVSDINKVLTK